MSNRQKGFSRTIVALTAGPGMSFLRDKISAMTEAREYPKTICPSEVARALTKDELSSLDCADWRAAMEHIREEAWLMKAQGMLDIMQKGELVKASTLEEIRGPIRLRKAISD
jgi:hypothetical protein